MFFGGGDGFCEIFLLLKINVGGITWGKALHLFYSLASIFWNLYNSNPMGSMHGILWYIYHYLPTYFTIDFKPNR